MSGGSGVHDCACDVNAAFTVQTEQSRRTPLRASRERRDSKERCPGEGGVARTAVSAAVANRDGRCGVDIGLPLRLEPLTSFCDCAGHLQLPSLSPAPHLNQEISTNPQVKEEPEEQSVKPEEDQLQVCR
ncbi:hypothetical protein WMY93_007426 [Mugilogobius chulae]|uniref:Uncharacterized protein n=1 Tax=Mugilogobius chulae TaxID=88201 RepID=A0AAW0PEF4_9GOBI